MLVEHQLITVRPAEAVLAGCMQYLMQTGFTLLEVTPRMIRARRGRRYPDSMRVACLPHEVSIEYDRGRVTLTSGVTPRGEDTDRHAQLAFSVVSSLHGVIVDGMPTTAAAEQFALAAVAAGRHVLASDWVRWSFLTLAGLVSLAVVMTQLLHR